MSFAFVKYEQTCHTVCVWGGGGLDPISRPAQRSISTPSCRLSLHFHSPPVCPQGQVPENQGQPSGLLEPVDIIQMSQSYSPASPFLSHRKYHEVSCPELTSLVPSPRSPAQVLYSPRSLRGPNSNTLSFLVSGDTIVNCSWLHHTSPSVTWLKRFIMLIFQ